MFSLAQVHDESFFFWIPSLCLVRFSYSDVDTWMLLNDFPSKNHSNSLLGPALPKGYPGEKINKFNKLNTYYVPGMS